MDCLAEAELFAGLSRWRSMNPSDRIKLSVALSAPSAHHAAPSDTHTHAHTHIVWYSYIRCKYGYTAGTVARGSHAPAGACRGVHNSDLSQCVMSPQQFCRSLKCHT